MLTVKKSKIYYEPRCNYCNFEITKVENYVQKGF